MGDMEPPHIQLRMDISSSMTTMNSTVDVRSHSNGKIGIGCLLHAMAG